MPSRAGRAERVFVHARRQTHADAVQIETDRLVRERSEQQAARQGDVFIADAFRIRAEINPQLELVDRREALGVDLRFERRVGRGQVRERHGLDHGGGASRGRRERLIGAVDRRGFPFDRVFAGLGPGGDHTVVVGRARLQRDARTGQVQVDGRVLQRICLIAWHEADRRNARRLRTNAYFVPLRPSGRTDEFGGVFAGVLHDLKLVIGTVAQAFDVDFRFKRRIGRGDVRDGLAFDRRWRGGCRERELLAADGLGVGVAGDQPIDVVRPRGQASDFGLHFLLGAARERTALRRFRAAAFQVFAFDFPGLLIDEVVARRRALRVDLGLQLEAGRSLFGRLDLNFRRRGRERRGGQDGDSQGKADRGKQSEAATHEPSTATSLGRCRLPHQPTLAIP